MLRLFSMAKLSASYLVARANIKSERGATAVEYAVMVALIAAVIVIAVIVLGRAASSTFSQTGQCIEGRTAADCPAS